MNESNDHQTCQFFVDMKGDLACDRDVVEGRGVYAQHLLGEDQAIADD